MISFLKDQGYFDENSNPSEGYLKMDMFRVVETSVTTSGNKVTYNKKVFITKKGMSSIIRRVLNYRIKTDPQLY
jgi:phage antirepressor YoqD-like protein